MTRRYFNTPKGIAIYPSLQKPNDKFNKFQCNLKVSDSEELKEFLAIIDGKCETIRDETIQALNERAENATTGAEKKRVKESISNLSVNKPYTENVDDNGDVLAGEWVLKTSCPAEGKSRQGTVYQNKVAVFDSTGKPFPKDIDVWGGSEVILQVEPRMYYVAGISKCGVSLRLRAAQIIELVSGGKGNADSYGFSTQEGYSAPEEDATVKDTKPLEVMDDSKDDSIDF